jgi:hypothetical protein
MKALSKDRTRRYGSASEFSADVVRYLANDPVLAGPPGALYLLKKFVQRNRIGVAVVGVLIAFNLISTLLGLALIRRSFTDYFQRWERSLATLPSEQLFQGSAAEIARALLLRLERSDQSVVDRDRDRIVLGLNATLREIPSIRVFVIVDRDRRIRYANEPAVVNLAFVEGDYSRLFASDQLVRRSRSTAMGGYLTEVMVPVFDESPHGEGERRRLGSLLIQFGPDADLVARLPQIRPPAISPTQFTLPLLAFGALFASTGIVLALGIGFAIRRR